MLTAYAAEIDEMKQRGGYVTADVIDVNPGTPGLDAMLGRGIVVMRRGKKVADDIDPKQTNIEAVERIITGM